MAASSIRIGLIGAGKNTRERHIPGFQAIDGVEVVSVCNRSLESSQRVADQFGIPKVIENWQDLVADDDIDAICIGTWPYLHCSMTLAGLDNEKHVMTEARMAMNAGEAHDMLDAANASPGIVTQIVPSPFTFALDETISSLVADGYLGDLVAIDMNVNGNQFLEREAPDILEAGHGAQWAQHIAHGHLVRGPFAVGRPGLGSHCDDLRERSRAP